MEDKNKIKDTNKQQESLPDLFKGKILHPSLDYLTEGMVSVGFSYRTSSTTLKSVYVIAATGGLVKLITQDSFEVNGQTYFYDTVRNTKLPLLNERWGDEEMQKFVKDCNAIVI